MVGVRSEDRTEELACYGRWLAIASRVALVALVAAFAAYLAGWIPAVIPVEATPRLWGRAAQVVASVLDAMATAREIRLRSR